MAGLDRIQAGLFPQLLVRCCFSALPSGLQTLVEWLLCHQVTGAVLGATGIYWLETPYEAEALGGAGILPALVHAQHVKQITGRNTGVAGRTCLARICQFGLCKPSLVPLTGLPQSAQDLSATPPSRAQPGTAPHPHSRSAIDPATLQPQVRSAPFSGLRLIAYACTRRPDSPSGSGVALRMPSKRRGASARSVGPRLDSCDDIARAQAPAARTRVAGITSSTVFPVSCM